MGFFHADPHPGNLVATEDGCLAYFDFGMMGDIPRHYRVGLIRVVSNILVHPQNNISFAVFISLFLLEYLFIILFQPSCLIPVLVG